RAPAARWAVPRARRAPWVALAPLVRHARGASCPRGHRRWSLAFGRAARARLRRPPLRRARARSRERRPCARGAARAGDRHTPVVAIVGPTASGKSALAMQIAE